MLTERASKILEVAIQGFIDEGYPISSGWLCDHHDFGIKSAMVRSELEDLSDKGFLEQPHHSAGRVPSDKGYKFFVERILESGARTKECDWTSGLYNTERWPDLLERMSLSLGTLSAATDAHSIYKTGMNELLERLEWDEPQTIKEIVRDFVNLESRIGELVQAMQTESMPKVFIGRSPLTQSSELSVIAGSYEDSDKKISLVAIGPKRMNYKKAIELFKSLARCKTANPCECRK